MDKKSFQKTYDEIAPLVEGYYKEYFPNIKGMPSKEALRRVAPMIQSRLLADHPEVRPLIMDENDDEVTVAYFGCGCILWLILIGVAFWSCGCGGGGCEPDYSCKDRELIIPESMPSDDDPFTMEQPFRFHS